MPKKTKTRKAKVEVSMDDVVDGMQRLADAVTAIAREVAQLKKGTTATEDPKPSKTVKPVRDQAVKQAVSDATTRKSDVQDIKARYELWSYDEYNQGSIVSAGPRFDKIQEAAKKFLTESNVDNALTYDQKGMAWEAYMPVVFEDGQPSNDIIYGGNKRSGKHMVYVRGDSKWELIEMEPGTNLRFYLGENSNRGVKSDWYAADHKGKPVTSPTDILLERKTVLFLKIINAS